MQSVTYRGFFNFRDLGGHETADGRTVVTGRLFRSGRFEVLEDTDAEHLVRALGVTRLIDLRTDGELEVAGELELVRRYRQVRVHHVPFFSQLGRPHTGDEPAPPSRGRVRASDQSWQPAALSRRYIKMTVETGRFSLARVVDVLTSPGALPAAFHCWSGKDRTGITAAVLMELLGVPDQTIAADYAATSEWFATHLPGHPDLQSAPTPAAYQLDPETMVLTLEGLRAQFGSVEQMVIESGGRAGQIEALRNELLS
jgi:protein-tyrosine phosphatase